MKPAPILLLAAVLAAPAASQKSIRISVGLRVESDGSSSQPSISADGCTVAFASSATNLVPADTNGFSDIFVWSRETRAVERVSVDSAGAQAAGISTHTSISADGRWVAFQSQAALVADDVDGLIDVYVRDRWTGTTVCASVDSTGAHVADGTAQHPALSADGRWVVFKSSSVLLDVSAPDTNGADDVFRHDLWTGATERVSVAAGGLEANGASYGPCISRSGRWIAFLSLATDLDGVVPDTNGRPDVFVRDDLAGTTVRILGEAGAEPDGFPSNLSISADGARLAFQSSSSNLAAADANGATADVFVIERRTGTVRIASVDSNGVQGAQLAVVPELSRDGRWVAFVSPSPLDGRTGGLWQTFVHDLEAGQTTMTSLAPHGAPGNGPQNEPAVANTGRTAFRSSSTDLAPDDTNGTSDVFVADPDPASVSCTGKTDAAGRVPALTLDFDAWAPSGAPALLTPGATETDAFWFPDPSQLDDTGIGLSDTVRFVVRP